MLQSLRVRKRRLNISEEVRSPVVQDACRLAKWWCGQCRIINNNGMLQCAQCDGDIGDCLVEQPGGELSGNVRRQFGPFLAKSALDMLLP